MLVQARDGQALGQQGGDDLAQSMVPFMRNVVLELNLCRHVGAAFGPDERLLALEVGVLDRQQPVRPSLLQRPQHRMPLADEKPPPWAQQAGHDARPAPDAGQPAQCANPGVHEVEAAGGQHVEGAVDVGLHELGGRPGLPGQVAGLLECGGGEVQPGHDRAEAGQRQCVGADVALQVHAAQAADVAQPGLVEPDHAAQEAGVGHELVHGVLRRGRVRRGPLVPAGPVHHLVVLWHASSLPASKARRCPFWGLPTVAARRLFRQSGR